MTRLLIIIPAEILDAVRAAAAQVFGDVAKAAFVPMGSPTGEWPAMHWWLAGLFTEEEAAKISTLKTAFPTALVESYDMKTQPDRPWELLKTLGLQQIKFKALI